MQETNSINSIVKSNKFESFIQVLIIFSLFCYALETLPELSQSTVFILEIIEKVTIAIFLIEFALRTYVYSKEYLISWDAIIDGLATFPLILPLPLDIRYIRLLRVLRIAKLFKKSKAYQRTKLAFKSIQDDLLLFAYIVLILLFISSAGIYQFEHEVQPEHFKSIFHSFWWSIVTLTTVGYGDIYPITIGGRIFTSIIILIGVGIVAIPTGLIASAFNSFKDEDIEK